MDQTEIISAIRRAIGETVARRVSDTIIGNIIIRAVVIVGLRIKEKDPSYFNKRKAISSYTHVFSWPSDCKKVVNVWDYNGSAASITGAADNGSGAIRITAASHGLSDEKIVTIHDVAGTAEANGTWKIEYVNDDTFDLLGSVFANTYTSGGSAFEEKTDMVEIKKKNISEQSGSDAYRWYPREKNIVVDDVDYTSDIIVDYEGNPTTTAEIPGEYHEYLISWPVLNLVTLPAKNDKDYEDRRFTIEMHSSIVNMVESDIQRTFKASSGPTQIRNVWT
jgi:hypothetical protein